MPLRYCQGSAIAAKHALALLNNAICLLSHDFFSVQLTLSEKNNHFYLHN
jgi:hypothetical protein